MISSPTNFLYALGISDREVRKDKETFFTRKLLAHQEAATQYYIMWNLKRRVSEQVKNWNFFLSRQTIERSKQEDFHQFWSSEYCAQIIWKVTVGTYQNQLKIQWVDWLRAAYQWHSSLENPFFRFSIFILLKKKGRNVLFYICVLILSIYVKKGFLVIKNYSTDTVSSQLSVKHELSAGPSINSMRGTDWDMWGSGRPLVPLQNYRPES